MPLKAFKTLSPSSFPAFLFAQTIKGLHSDILGKIGRLTELTIKWRRPLIPTRLTPTQCGGTIEDA